MDFIFTIFLGHGMESMLAARGGGRRYEDMTDKKRKIKLQTRSRVVDGWMDGWDGLGLVFLTDRSDGVRRCYTPLPLLYPIFGEAYPFFLSYLKCPPIFALAFEEKKRKPMFRSARKD